jgi:hypothetical protein
MTADSSSARAVGRRTGRGDAAPLVVALAYVLTWVIGLAIGAPELTPEHDGAVVIAAYETSPAALLQAVLVHGVAGLLIGVLAVLHARRGAGLSRPRRILTLVAGALAALLSWVQLAGEVALIQGFPAADAAWQLWATVAVVDGAKMLALAVLVVATLPRLRALPLRILAGLAAASLVVSGVGYLSLQLELMSTAYVSLPLLLVWAVVSALLGRNPAALALRSVVR